MYPDTSRNTLPSFRISKVAKEQQFLKSTLVCPLVPVKQNDFLYLLRHFTYLWYINMHLHSFSTAPALRNRKMAQLLIFLCVLFAPVATSKLTTFLRDKNLTSVEERLSYLEQKIESRLNATERVLGQLLTGRADVRLEDLDILTLRSGKLIKFIL